MKAMFKRLLLAPAQFFNTQFLYISRLEFACARGALNAATRRVDPDRPSTWEFAAFSQNGEDGVIDYLLSFLRSPNAYFIEIGASDGLENNSSYLAYVKKFSGLMVEANPYKARSAERFLQSMNWGVRYLQLFVTPENAAQVVGAALHEDPDFLSVDIDGNDLHVTRSLLKAGLRPKLLCVEYNSAFGPNRAITIPYTPGFDYLTAHPTQLYYGVSLMAWQNLLAPFGYRFLTVETRGINAFFVREDALSVDFPLPSQPLAFAENVGQLRLFPGGWEEQWPVIAGLPYEEVVLDQSSNQPGVGDIPS